MTPHILLLTSAQEVGGQLMLPIASIAFMVPLGKTTRIFLNGRDEYLDVTEEFRTIQHALGGLVMTPPRANAWPNPNTVVQR